MMGALRDKKLMKVVLWLLVVVFVGFIFLAWGMQVTGIGSPKDPNAVARVGKTVITQAEFNDRYQPVYEQLSGETDGALSDDSVKDLRRQVLDSLIDDVLTFQTADRLGIRVSNEEVAESIRSDRYFMDQNQRFDKARYLKILEQIRQTPGQYEESQRRQLLLQKIQGLLLGATLTTPEEIRNYADFLNRDLKALRVALSPQRFSASLSPTTDELQEFYESHRDRYDRQERAKVRHVLLTLREGATPQEAEVVQKALEDYRALILSGKDTFENIAKKHSQDDGSKKEGGSLGWIPRNSNLDPEFGDAIFSLKKGAISKPVKTNYGYHLIKLEDYEPAYQSTFEAVRTTVSKDYKANTAERKIREVSAQLAQKLQAGETLEKAAEELHLSSESTSWFSRTTGIPGITDSRKLSEVLAELHLSDWKGPLSVDETRYFFQIIAERDQPLSDKKFESDRASSASRLEASKKTLWVKTFLKAQREETKVNVYLDQESEPEQPLAP